MPGAAVGAQYARQLLAILLPGLRRKFGVVLAVQIRQPLAGVQQADDVVLALAPLRGLQTETPEFARGQEFGREIQVNVGLRQTTGPGHVQPLPQLRVGLGQRLQALRRLVALALQPFAQGREQTRQTRAPKRMLAGRAQRCQAHLAAFDGLAFAAEVRRRPGRAAFNGAGGRQPGPCGFCLLQAQQFAESVVGRDVGLANRRIDGRRVGVQPLAGQIQAIERRADALRIRLAQRLRPFQFVQDGRLGCFVAVQFQAGDAQMNAVQPAFHDLQRRLFFRHEEHRLALADGFGDDVRDGLRFARAGRALNNQVAAGLHVFDGQHLRRVRVEHVERVLGGQAFVQVIAFAEIGRRFLRKARTEERGHEFVVLGPRARRPPVGIQILVHQILVEGEETEHDARRIDGPTRLAANALGHLPEVGVQVLDGLVLRLGVEERYLQPELKAHLFPEGLVGHDVLVVVLDLERGVDVLALDQDGDQNQRGLVRGLAAVVFVPRDHAQSDEQRVDALFLDGRARMTFNGAQARVQRVLGLYALQLGRTPSRPRGGARRFRGALPKRHGPSFEHERLENGSRLRACRFDALLAVFVVQQVVASIQLKEFLSGFVHLGPNGIGSHRR